MTKKSAKAMMVGNPIFWLTGVCAKRLPPKRNTPWDITKHPEKDVYELWYGAPGAPNESYKTWNGPRVRELMSAKPADIEAYFGDILGWISTKA